MTVSPFIQLVRMALGTGPAVHQPFSEAEWDEIFALAKKQSLVGVVGKAVEQLPEEVKPPRRIKVQFALYVEKIAERNALLDRYAAILSGKIGEMGLRSCVLKGQGTAMLYPWPEVRQSGDIDLWVDGGHREVVPLLRRMWKVPKVFYHHAEVCGLPDKVSLEVHFRPSWMNSPFANARLQRYFRQEAPLQFENPAIGKGYNKPTTAFDCVYALVHIYRHLLQEGVGMRQLMDYHFILSSSSEDERKNALAGLKALGMEKFVPAVMYVLKELFRTSDELLLCAPDPKYGTFLLDEIEKSGNFGIYDERNHIRSARNLPERFVCRMEYLSRFTGLALSEVFWAPVFKTWQLIWRIINKY